MTEDEKPPAASPTDLTPNASSSGSCRAPASSGNVKVAVGVLLATVVAFAASYQLRRAPAGQAIQKSASTLAEHLRAERHPRWADEVAAASAKGPCLGAERAAARGLDGDLSNDVLALLGLMNQHCAELPALRGLHAEALTRAAQAEAGESEAVSVLKAAPGDPYALYARALGAWRGNRASEALGLAQRAIDAGRGATAYLLKGLIAYSSNQLEVAEASFRSMLELDPDNVEGVYNLSLVHHRQTRYRLAREGYLQVLRLQPAHTDARYNLALLAHSIGANDEAQHHLAKLRTISTDAAQLAKLEALLAVPAATAHTTASSPGFSLALGASSAHGPAPSAPSAPSALAPAPAASAKPTE